MPTPKINIILNGIDNFSKTLKAANISIEKFGKATTKLGKSMTVGLSLPIAAFGALSVKEFATYESSLARVQAMTGATTQQLELMKQTTRGIGRTTRYSAVEAAGGLQQMVESGFSLEDAMTGLPKVLQMSTLGMMELADAVDFADMISEAYGRNASQLTEVNDKLAAVAPKAGVSFGALSKAMLTISPVAQTLGLSFEDTVASIAILGQSGVKMETAMKGMRTGLSQLISPSRQVGKVMQKLGVKKEDLFDSGKLKSMSALLDTLQKKGASAADMVEIFGVQAGPMMNILLKRGSAGLAEFQAAMEGSAGAADKMQKIIDETTEGKLARFNAAVKELNISFADNMMPILTKVMNVLIKVMNAFGNLSPAMQKILTVGAMIVAALGPILVMIGSIITSVGAIAANWGIITAAFTLLKVIVVAVGSAIGVTGALFIAAAAIWIYNINLIRKGWQDIVDVFSSWTLLLRTVKFFLADIGISLLKLAMPKFLEKLVGITPRDEGKATPASPSPATATAAVTGGALGRSGKQQVVMSFENVPRGTRILDKKGDADLNMEYGLNYAGAQ